MRHNQNRRSRSRSRKGPNPLTRSFESNGPEGKVRGTAAHVAERYLQMARDALSSGDTVAAESFFQHAEHYNRIVMAAQAQFQPNQPMYGRDMDDDEDDGDGEPFDPRFGQQGGRDMQPSDGIRSEQDDGRRYQGRREPQQFGAPGNSRDMGGEGNGRGPGRGYDERGPDEARPGGGSGETSRSANGRQRYVQPRDPRNTPGERGSPERGPGDRSPAERGSGDRSYAPRSERNEIVASNEAAYSAPAMDESDVRLEENAGEAKRPARAPRKRRPRLASEGGEVQAGGGSDEAPRNGAEGPNGDQAAVTPDGAAALTAFPDRV